ncbi:IS66 family transposase [Thiomonas sp. 13-64-67]|uniref:IS66 family transposase n=1 Tax=Thiomonas sp. 13-64-67 TaxID=1970447 RepID=UPI000BD04087|nr:IS66 family transposase [Thiomonas sp. 13-64-67]OZB68823.1 MAG: IS66 family transposase [Thiomonas sp. 13-64-67]
MVAIIDDDTLRTLGQDPAAQYARDLIGKLAAEVEQQAAEIRRQAQKNAALSLEVARLKHWRFGQSSESLDDKQGELFDAKTIALLEEEERAEDRAADDERASPSKRRPKRQPLPGSLERIEHRYEIDSGLCPQGHPLKRIGEEISEQLDCEPARFFVHRHIRGKYACACCQTVLAAPLPAQVIDKGIPAPGLMAQMIVAKHDDHLPAYRQEEIYARSGVRVPRSSITSWIGIGGVWLQPLAQAVKELMLQGAVLHADETPVAELKPGAGKTHRAYVWVYRSAQQPLVAYDYRGSRGGEHAREFLRDWSGTLVVDDFSGYKALFASGAIREAGCWTHARRKFFEAHKLTQSALAAQALERIGEIYRVEQDIGDLDSDERLRRRRQDTQPRLDALHAWMLEQRPQLAKADATARAIDYALGRWASLSVFATDARVPIDNNAAERAVRPIALGRKNWLFVGSRQAGERAAALMTLIESAKLCGLEPWAYLRDVFAKLPTWPNSRLDELLPHRWASAAMPTTPALATA